MAAILGISAFYHDSAAALVVDGRIVAAAQEERLSWEKGVRNRRAETGTQLESRTSCAPFPAQVNLVRV